mmetsp:Transcript_2701/g.5688  ORF Transcript_2701/g.5688 Transcript_2701/m.5688 type:complete len:733 (-) Transcript_2701:1666-3864(-)
MMMMMMMAASTASASRWFTVLCCSMLFLLQPLAVAAVGREKAAFPQPSYDAVLAWRNKLQDLADDGNASSTSSSSSLISYRQDVCDRYEQVRLGNIPLRDALQGLQLRPLMRVNKFFRYTDENGIDPLDPGLMSVMMDELARRAGFTWRETFSVVHKLPTYDEWQQQAQDQQQDQQQHDIVATIMGGSCSAHAGAGCPFNTKANPLGGRYSNQLDYWHHKEEEAEEQQPHDDDNLFKLHIRNMGQGATTSDFNALFLDHFLDANHRRTTTAAPLPNHRNDGEFLVWEFGVNDIAGDIPTEEQVRKLDFWLKRVHSYYLQQGRRVPPIIFVHIWPYQTGRRMLAEANAISGRYNSTTLWSRRPDPQQLWPETTTPMDRVGALLREYQSQGWDIGLLDVGSVINVTQVLWMSAARHMMMDGDGDSGNNHPISFPFELFADNTHPSCMGNGLIADLLQYFLYSNVASCDADVVEEEEDSKKKKKAAEQVAAAAPQRNLRRTHHKVATDHDPQDLSVPHRKDVLGPDIDPQWKGLWTDLFHERTKVGSLTPWLPTLTMTTANQHKAKDSGWTKTSPFISSLNIVNRHEVNSWPIVQAVDPKHPDIPLPENRGDRKHSYAIPKCGRKDLKLELQEPDLKWLGLSVVEESNISEDLMIQINGQSVDPELLRRNDGLWSPMRYDHRWIKHWVNIQDASSSSSAAHDAPTSSQVIRLCHNGRDNIQLPLYHLVGVVVPKG